MRGLYCWVNYPFKPNMNAVVFLIWSCSNIVKLMLKPCQILGCRLLLWSQPVLKSCKLSRGWTFILSLVSAFDLIPSFPSRFSVPQITENMDEDHRGLCCKSESFNGQAEPQRLTESMCTTGEDVTRATPAQVAEENANSWNSFMLYLFEIH